MTPLPVAEGVVSPEVQKAMRLALEDAGLSISKAGESIDGRGNLQRRLRGAVAVTPDYAAKFEKAVGIRRGAIENLVRAELIRLRDAEVQKEIRKLLEEQKKLRSLLLKLS